MKNSVRTRQDAVRSKVLHVAARLFLEKGYTNTSLREISAAAGVAYGSMTFAFGTKEGILSELVEFVLDGQFEAAERLVKGRTEDKILFYAVETTLQLYMAESSDHIRELYTCSYSQEASSKKIYNKITLKLSEIFKETYPQFQMVDFFEKELASAGVMRNYMTRPCDLFFPMERKVRAFLENTFLIYEVPREKIEEAVDFVSGYDFESIASEVISNMLAYLESRT